MADRTKIEWTDATWNPITGCAIVSPGCTNCYAMKLAGTRLRHIPSRAGLTRDTKAGPVWTGEVRFNREWADQPLSWRRPRMIFVCAHGDLFAEGVPDQWIDHVFAVMALAPQHTFQVLTKRAERMRDYCRRTDDRGRHLAMVQAALLAFTGRWNTPPLDLRSWPLPNVWLGVSVEDQRRATERIPMLLDTPAEVRWISAEPLLGPVDLTDWLVEREEHGMVGQQAGFRPPLDWVVVGGESGIAARPCDPQWVRPIRDACARFGVPFLFKQWGSWHSDALRYTECSTGLCPPPKMRIGKKAAGRHLDGVLHDGFPQTEEIPFG